LLGITNAEHEETSPDGENLVISKLSCSLVGQTRTLIIVPGTKASTAYPKVRARENFLCNYGLNTKFRSQIEKEICVSGFDEDGDVRMIELPQHPFYVATLFVPQMNSTPESPHPLISSFVRAMLK
jgi:CTP synthase (UTP-ammonia lyase)